MSFLSDRSAVTFSPARGSEERCELPQCPDRPKFFTISALRMASPDTIKLLIVDYHTATAGQDPRVSLAYAAVSK